MNRTLLINEIFLSIQGESSRAGYPCVFVRLTGCSSSCTWCDTRYAMTNGTTMSLQTIIDTVARFKTPLVEITGGEPLEQENVYPLMQQLCNRGYNVMLETGGFHPVSRVDHRVHKIIDLKPPSSGSSGNNHETNIRIALEAPPAEQTLFEFKIVIAGKEDYEWATRLLQRTRINEHCPVVMGTVFSELSPAMLASWILKDHLNVRMQLQLHKYIWPPDMRGV